MSKRRTAVDMELEKQAFGESACAGPGRDQGTEWTLISGIFCTSWTLGPTYQHPSALGPTEHLDSTEFVHLKPSQLESTFWAAQEGRRGEPSASAALELPPATLSFWWTRGWFHHAQGSELSAPSGQDAEGLHPLAHSTLTLLRPPTSPLPRLGSGPSIYTCLYHTLINSKETLLYDLLGSGHIINTCE